MDIFTQLRIYHQDFFFIILGALKKVPSHSHNAVQIFINTEGTQEIKVEGQILIDPVIFIDKNIKHEVIRSDKKQISILIDGDSDLAKHLSHLFLIKKKDSFEQQLFNYNDLESPQNIKRELYKLLQTKGCDFCLPTDNRIIKVKELIDNDNEKKLSIKLLAEYVGLSQSRLAHVFKDEVGIPIRKYLLWKRLISAFRIVINGKNITYAAYQSGFSDSAHLSRTFKSNFGINLSKVYKNSKFIQFKSL